MNKLLAVLLAARPKTLPAGIVPVWLGAMIVWRYQRAWPDIGFQLNMHWAVLTLVSALCLQIACNFFNDAIDFRKQADTPARQGPERMTAGGKLPPLAVAFFGCLFLLGACAAAWPLIELRGWPLLAIGIPSLYFAYGYTGGPWPLAYKGLGEAFVILFFGIVAVMGTVYVQIGWQPGFVDIYTVALMVGIQCGMLSSVLIEVNNIRDRKEDAQTGKHTLAVRLGDARARGLAMAFIVATYLTLPQVANLLPGLTLNVYWLPLVLMAGLLILKINKTPADKRMNRVLGLAALHLILFAATLTFV